MAATARVMSTPSRRGGSSSITWLLCTAIVGGAAIPYLAGHLSDAVGYAAALALPAACYVLLCIFAIAAGRAPARQATAGATVH